ncbi:MAG TPA: glycosyltransferase [Acidimicrobiales bacterium]|jgi:glycosyltransferase involved in cell wall biosynthesis
MAKMTIAIASYQRRESLLRLLRRLDGELAASEELCRDLDVVVVLDGSTDGSREAVEREPWRVPTKVYWQSNRGLASARNVGLDAAKGGIVWFLDDDLVPSSGLVARHRRAHLEGSPRVVVGPCRIPPEVGAPAPLLRWWDSFYRDLEEAGVIDRFDRFTTANASGPAALFTAVGGFDESFVGYGLEDYELAVRLLRAGTPLRFDSHAVAWHPDVPPMSLLMSRERSVGLNAARIAHLHPETVEALFPDARIPAPRQLLRKLRVRSPRSLMAVSRAAFILYRVSGSLHADSARRAELLCRAAAHAAGLAEGDPSGTLLGRVLGYSSDGDRNGRGARRSRARSSRQPAASPKSSDTTISR